MDDIRSQIEGYLKQQPIRIKTSGADGDSLVKSTIDCEIRPDVWVLLVGGWLVSTTDYMHFLQNTCGIKAKVDKVHGLVKDSNGVVLYVDAFIWHHTDETEKEGIKAPLVIYIEVGHERDKEELGKLLGLPFDQAIKAFDPIVEA